MSEVPTNTSSSGNVAGLDNNPPVRLKRKPDDKFAGHAVFDVSSDIYNKAPAIRKKWNRWAKFVPIAEDLEIVLESLIDFSINNPKDGIIIRDKSTGYMRYIKHKE